MTVRMLDWVKLPTEWIEEGGLRKFRWVGGAGADNTAALMVLMAVAHRADQTSGLSIVTYDELEKATGLSRAKVASALAVLESAGLIERGSGGRSVIGLADFDPSGGWSKFPARRLYQNETISAFADFHLRKPAELDALKLYYLFVSRRGNDTNLANIGYDKISQYSGVDRDRIKRGLSVLAVCGLVHVERIPSLMSEHGVANAYRVAHIDPYVHMGTRGRGLNSLASI